MFARVLSAAAQFVAGRRTKWLVLVVWLGVLAGASPFASKMFDVAEDNAATYLPKSAEATRVLDLEERLDTADFVLVAVVYERTSGITAEDRQRATAELAAIQQKVETGGQEPLFEPAEDGRALLYAVPVSTEGARDRDTAAVEAVDSVRGVVGRGDGGLTVAVTGPAGFQADATKTFEGLETKLILLPFLVVTVLLLLIYRSPVLWLVPLLSVVVAEQLSAGVVYGLVSADALTLSNLAAGIMGVLVYGAGTDYALLLVARYREELRRHEDRHDAMRAALSGATPAIVASAATVCVGLLCLLVADLNSNRGLGPIGAVAVACAVLAMLTLLPAVLVILGRWVFWPIVPHFGSAPHEESGVLHRLGARIARRPRLVWTSTSVVLLALVVGLMTFQAPLRDQFREAPESVVGQDIVAAHYPAGASQPVDIIATSAGAEAVLEAARSTEGVAAVEPAGSGDGLVQLQAVLTAAPGSAAEEDIVVALRERLHAVPGAEALVGGTAATNIDLNRAALRDAQLIIPLVLIAVLLILGLLLRAVLGPVLLILTVIVSFAAALGASSFVFDRLFGFEGADASLPLLAFVFLVALGIDYNVFLMSRVREETLALAPSLGAEEATRRGTLRGLAVTGGVITSAGVVLAATFAVLVALPLVAFVQLGFTVALGILLDTFVVRSILTPALVIDTGRRIWWPSRLSHVEPAPTPTSQSEPDPARG